MPLVSVVVPTFNRASQLMRAIDSIRLQTWRDLEIIVVDDGSTDDTFARVRRIAAVDDRVRYLRQENRGVASARNTGIESAQGDLIAFLDSDDLWLPWKLELQMKAMTHAPEVGMVWTDMDAVDADDHVIRPRYLRKMYSCWNHYPDARTLFERVDPLAAIAPEFADRVGSASFYSGNVFSPMIRGSLVHTSTVLIHRSRIERVGGFDEALAPSGEDFDFHLRTCYEGPVGFLDVVTICYRIGMDDQLTSRKYGIHLATNYLRAIQPFLDHHRPEIHLSSHEIRSVLGEAHQWIGEERFWRKEWRAARRHLATGLLYVPSSLRAWKLLAASVVPFVWF